MAWKAEQHGRPVAGSSARTSGWMQHSWLVKHMILLQSELQLPDPQNHQTLSWLFSVAEFVEEETSESTTTPHCAAQHLHASVVTEVHSRVQAVRFSPHVRRQRSRLCRHVALGVRPGDAMHFARVRYLMGTHRASCGCSGRLVSSQHFGTYSINSNKTTGCRRSWFASSVSHIN